LSSSSEIWLSSGSDDFMEEENRRGQQKDYKNKR